MVLVYIFQNEDFDSVYRLVKVLVVYVINEDLGGLFPCGGLGCCVSFGPILAVRVLGEGFESICH